MIELNERDRRIAENENEFRRANELLNREYGREWPEGMHFPLEEYPFMCECGGPSCTAEVTVMLGTYEQLRAHPTRFLIAPGHKQLDCERIVERGLGYEVVDKSGEAAVIAEADWHPSVGRK